MPDDAGVFQQALHVAPAKLCNDGGIEIPEGLSEVLALAENRDPAQPGLKALEADLLEQTAVVGDRPAPLVIVIPDVEVIFTRPPAAFHFFDTFFAFLTFAAFGLASASRAALTFL